MNDRDIQQLIIKLIEKADKTHDATDWNYQGQLGWTITNRFGNMLGRVNAIIDVSTGNTEFTYKHLKRIYKGVKKVDKLIITGCSIDTDHASECILAFDHEIIKAHNIKEDE